MFRNYYAEQGMEDPRDSWYRPNLLYNIHYRPPKQATPPPMKVVTKKFNPSICTCGEHDCGPRYRMEREVVWLNKEQKKKVEIELDIKNSDDVSHVKDEGDDISNVNDKCDDAGEESCEPERPELDVQNLDNGEDFGSSFGIMRVYADSGLHTAWAGKNEVHAY